MPRLVVKIFASLQEFVGSKSVELEARATSVKELIRELSKEYGSELEENLLDSRGRLRPNYRIFVNGRSIDGEDLTARVKNGDVVVIFPVLDGG